MEKMVFVVRKAVEADIPEVKEVSKEAFKMYAEGAGITSMVVPLEETYEDLRREIDNKLVLVALLDGVIVGCVRVEVYEDNTAYLSRFGVRGDFQNQGIGKILMNAVDSWMKQLGVTNLYLHTASRMLSLVRFYYGRGFYIESTTKDRGYIRALLCKEYEASNAEIPQNAEYQNLAVV
jgi:N-acetylglutamate synthase-like GNAT family acetyltransferase